jgi:hypothetical protein
MELNFWRLIIVIIQHELQHIHPSLQHTDKQAKKKNSAGTSTSVKRTTSMDMAFCCKPPLAFSLVRADNTSRDL